MNNLNNQQNESANSLLNNSTTGTATIGLFNQTIPWNINSNYITSPSYYSNEVINPDVYITINGNRKKNHNGLIYLNDGDEYQFEFFNKNTITLGILISIDEKQISSSHLIIKPGQRIHLDRFINDNKKFLFKTYDVESNNKDVDNAIKNNGKIEVSFYKEYTYNTITLTGNSSNYMYGTTANYNTITCSNTSNLKETGKTESGSISNQSFTSLNKSFDYLASYIFNCQLLPNSIKPIETKDLIQHCTQCGTKYDKKDNFCRKCGNKK